MLPFTRDQFFSVFAAYGDAMWPAQIAAYGLGIAALIALARGGLRPSRIVAAVLAVMWLVTGVGYHFLHFATINPAAYAFAALFAMQGAMFAAISLGAFPLFFLYRRGLSGVLGVTLIAYALVVYPIVGLAQGHVARELPAFGLTPCPVTLFTLGCLLLTASRVPTWLMAIPVLWSLIGGTAAFLLDVPQDWALLVGGPAALAVLAIRPRPLAVSPAASPGQPGAPRVR